MAIAANDSVAVGGYMDLDPRTFDTLEHRGQLVEWSTRDGRIRRALTLPWPVVAIALTPDAGHAIVSGDSGVAVVDLASGQVTIGPGQPPAADWIDGTPEVALTRDGRRAVVARRNHLLLVDTSTAVTLADHALPDRDLVSSLAWSADGRTLVVGEETGMVRFLSATSFDPVAPPRQVAPGFVIATQISPDGRYLATLGSQGDLMLWDARSWQPYGMTLTDNHGWGFVSFSPDSTRLRALFEDRTMWDMSVDRAAWVVQACHAANRELTPEEWAVLRPGVAFRPTC